LKAYEILNVKKPKLIIIGDTQESEFGSYLKNKYSHSAEFINFLSKDKLYQYIRNASFIVVPSIWYENMPNVVLESFAHGKAVIASNHGCFPELIKENHNGLLFEPGNTEALSDLLAWAIQNPKDMIQMGINARKMVEINFSPDSHFKKLYSLFNSLITT